MSGTVVTAIIFFGTERIWRGELPRLFPRGDLSAVQGPRLNVCARMVAVFLLMSLVPMAVLSAAAHAGLDEGVAAYNRGDYPTALSEFRPLAEKGDTSAQNRLGHMYMQGQGVARDTAAAIALWRKAADAGHATAQFNLSVAYGIGAGVSRDAAEADRWLRLNVCARMVAVFLLMSLVPMAVLSAAAHAGLDEGVAAYNRGDYPTALSEFRPLAEKGDTSAQNRLGHMYMQGQGVARDTAAAIALWRKAADAGHATAQFNLSVAYGIGAGVPRDAAEAERWLRKSAGQGLPSAQNVLASRYAVGLGVEKDEQLAVAWWRRAAAQGHAPSQFALGEAYRSGKGVAQDDQEALYWYRQAAGQGNESAQEALKRFQKR